MKSFRTFRCFPNIIPIYKNKNQSINKMSKYKWQKRKSVTLTIMAVLGLRALKLRSVDITEKVTMASQTIWEFLGWVCETITSP